MIIQISMVRDEVSLIKELLPIWNQYADGFVFLLDRCTDNTLDYLNQVKREFLFDKTEDALMEIIRVYQNKN